MPLAPKFSASLETRSHGVKEPSVAIDDIAVGVENGHVGGGATAGGALVVPLELEGIGIAAEISGVAQSQALIEGVVAGQDGQAAVGGRAAADLNDIHLHDGAGDGGIVLDDGDELGRVVVGAVDEDGLGGGTP